MNALRFLSTTAIVAGTSLLHACGSGDKAANTSAYATSSPDTTAAATAAAPAGSPETTGAMSAGETSGGATAAPSRPATGKTTKVQVIGDAKGYRYEPATLTIQVGDAVEFINVSGGPHNVTFWPDSIPPGAEAQLQANMPITMSPLTGPLLTTPNQTYVVSFAGLKPGVYKFFCTPHLALGMKGQLTLR